MQLSGSAVQFVLHRNRSHVIQPVHPCDGQGQGQGQGHTTQQYTGGGLHSKRHVTGCALPQATPAACWWFLNSVVQPTAAITYLLTYSTSSTTIVLHNLLTYSTCTTTCSRQVHWRHTVTRQVWAFYSRQQPTRAHHQMVLLALRRTHGRSSCSCVVQAIGQAHHTRQRDETKTPTHAVAELLHDGGV